MENSGTTDAADSWMKPQPRWRRRDGLFRFTVQQFCRLDQLGFFEDRKVELIRGLIFEMALSPQYAVSCNLAAEALRQVFERGWLVSHHRALDLGRRSLLVPDLYVTAGSIRQFTKSHPTTAALIVEISEATLKKDRTIKAHLYARANLAEYWIVNLIDRRLEVHRDPGPDSARNGRFRYASVTIVPESGRIAPLAAPDSVVPVSDLLP